MRKLVIAALLVSGPAFAQPTPTPANSQPSYDNDASPRVCRQISRIGSRLASQRICATQAQWDLYRRDFREWLGRMQSYRVNNGGF